MAHVTWRHAIFSTILSISSTYIEACIIENSIQKIYFKRDVLYLVNTINTAKQQWSHYHNDKKVAQSFPPFTLGEQTLQYVDQFRYLGHILNSRLNDDDDIIREIRNLFVRTNMLTTRFKKCSMRVKVKLFKAYCLCIYDMALWCRYAVGTFNKLKSCYHKCIKKLFNFARMDSMSGILRELNLPTYETIVHNSKCVFRAQSASTANVIVQHFTSIGLDLGHVG